ncbi:MAG: hypothetical protein WCT04_13900 [Planctomycetota bacterium]
MARIKGNNTKPELLVRKILYSIGYRYRLHALFAWLSRRGYVWKEEDHIRTRLLLASA